MDKKIEYLKSIVNPITEELDEVLIMTSEISDRFCDLSNSIKQLSYVAGIVVGRRTGVVMDLIGEAVNVFGQIKADDERDIAMRQVLMKKIELANLKLGVVISARKNLANQIDSFYELLCIEIIRPYDETKREEFEKLYGAACLDAFEMYVSIYYFIQVCDFMIEEFNAWIKYKHNSEFEIPSKSYILDFILNELIFPRGLKNGLDNRNLYAGFWLLSKRESIIGGAMLKVLIEGEKIEASKKKGFYSESYKKTNILKRESFLYLKTYVNEIWNVVEQDKTGNLKVITDSIIYKQAKDVCNIKSPIFYFFIRAYVVVFCFFIIGNYKNIASVFGTGLIACVPIAFVFSLVCKFFLWSNNVKSEGSCLESIFKFIVAVLSLGTIPILVKAYENKDISFNNYIVYLKKEYN